jgi:proteasome activator subunit 4
MKSLRNIKLRSFSRGPTDVILGRNHNPLKQKLAIVPSHELTQKFLHAYMVPFDLSQPVNGSTFVDKDPPGWLTWAHSLSVYEPPSATRSTFQPWENSSAPAIAAVREIALTPTFWTQLAMYFSEENHEVSVILDNVSYVKSICMFPKGNRAPRSRSYR